MLFGAVEIIDYEIVENVRSFLYQSDRSVSNVRSGIGIGITSLFLDRVSFGFMLNFGLLIAPQYIRNTLCRILINVITIVLIISSLSRTAIITATVMFIIRFIIDKEDRRSIITTIILLFMLFSLFITNTKINNLYSLLLNAINTIDATGSGRTIIWADRMREVSILPNFIHVGSSKYIGVNVGSLDNSYLRLLLDYGVVVLVALILLVNPFLKQNRKISRDKLLPSVVILSYSATVDIFHMFFVMVPFYFSLGILYSMEKSSYEKLNEI
jgi:hypothetical protein